MRQVGHRKEPPLQAHASAVALVAGAEFCGSIAQLAGGSTFVPKGVYRFRTHDEATLKNQQWLALGMARKALERQHG